MARVPGTGGWSVTTAEVTSWTLTSVEDQDTSQRSVILTVPWTANCLHGLSGAFVTPFVAQDSGTEPHASSSFPTDRADRVQVRPWSTTRATTRVIASRGRLRHGQSATLATASVVLAHVVDQSGKKYSN